MPFVVPMLAKTLKDEQIINPGEWAVEEKYDGHRMCVSINDPSTGLFNQDQIVAWSRDENERILPAHIVSELVQLPTGVYDGELLVPGLRSYGTTALDNNDKLILFIFDAVEFLGSRIIHMTYDNRRRLLKEAFNRDGVGQSVRLAPSTNVNSIEEVWKLRDEFWKRDAEGLVVKLRSEPYSPGKRSKSWLKVKQLRSAILTVVGYRSGQMGPQSVLVIRDDEGFETKVKAKNTQVLFELNQNPGAFVGRRLAIEFQERTPDGSYRHPRFDHWEEL